MNSYEQFHTKIHHLLFMETNKFPDELGNYFQGEMDFLLKNMKVKWCKRYPVI